MSVDLVLASASPARLATLTSAGVRPRVIVSDVDEPAVLEDARAQHRELGMGEMSPADAVLVLARAKAEFVTGMHDTGAIVLGCDSMLEFDGDVVGKPHTAEVATQRWRAMRGRSGTLHSGHWIIDDRPRGSGGSGTGATLGATSSTVVHFADLSDEEIDVYVATGEPLHVAGGFTVDGIGGPYVAGIDGDFHGVVGVSLPLLRELLSEVGVAFHELRDLP